MSSRSRWTTDQRLAPKRRPNEGRTAGRTSDASAMEERATRRPKEHLHARPHLDRQRDEPTPARTSCREHGRQRQIRPSSGETKRARLERLIRALLLHRAAGSNSLRTAGISPGARPGRKPSPPGVQQTGVASDTPKVRPISGWSASISAHRVSTVINRRRAHERHRRLRRPPYGRGQYERRGAGEHRLHHGSAS